MNDEIKSKEPLRVVDRRWWARGEEDSAGTEAATLKPAYVEDLERRLAAKEAELQETLTKYRAAAAEFEDVRVRVRRDAAREAERSRRALLADFLEVLDNLDRAIAAGRATDAASPIVQGVELVRDQFLAKLEAFGVTRMHAAGTTFDPARHDAIATVPTGDPAHDGMVIDVIREGYVIGDEILRPAAVAVAKLAQA